MLIDAVLCLQSQFEDCTFCMAIQGYCHCMPFGKKLAWTMIGRKILISSGKAKLSMASCARINSLVWSAALDGVTVAVNSPISLKY